MYAEIAAAISSTKTLGELLKAAHSLSNYNEFSAAVSDVNAKLMEATAVALKSQEKQAELQNRIEALDRCLRELKQIQEKSQQYLLHKFETGALAYKFDGSDPGMPDHFLCAKCFDSGTHTKLQPVGNNNYKCHACSSQVQHRFVPPVRISRQPSRGGFTKDW
jgi:hypothetical protein